MRGRRGGQRLNNHRIKPIESAYRAPGTNSNFMRDYSKDSVAASIVRLGPPSAACLQSVKSSTGRVIDQLNQARDISQDFLSDKFDFAEGNCTGLLNMQSASPDRNLPRDVTTLRDHPRDATLLWDHALDIASSTRNPFNLSFLERKPSSLPPKRLLQFGNVNTRSIRNQTAEFLHHVLDSRLDVCTVTEIWLNDHDTVSLASLSPSGFNFKNFPRPSERNGGGTGVFYNLSLDLSFFDGGEKSSFEFSEWKFSAHGRIFRLVVVYRPPYSKEHPAPASVFFQEFSAFLETTVLCPEVLLVSGDFNFHLDDPSDADARKFMELMDTFGLLQHITIPTHVSGHILDLIISRSSNDINVFPPKSTYYIYDLALLNVNYLSLVLICWSRKFLIGSSNSGQASKNWLSVMIPPYHKSWINTPP